MISIQPSNVALTQKNTMFGHPALSTPNMANDQVQNLPNHRYWPKQGRDFAGTHQFSMANKKVLKIEGGCKN